MPKKKNCDKASDFVAVIAKPRVTSKPLQLTVFAASIVKTNKTASKRKS